MKVERVKMEEEQEELKKVEGAKVGNGRREMEEGKGPGGGTKREAGEGKRDVGGRIRKVEGW